MTNPRLTRRRLLEGTTGLAIAGLAGCAGAPNAADQQQAEGDNPPGHGEEEHGHDQASEPQPSAEVAVNTARNEGSTEFHFDPHVTWIEAGGTVTWRLESGTHTATAYHPGNDQPRLVPEGTDAWDSGTMSETGETFEHTFETEGVYHYFCKPHERFGMLGTVIVGDPHLEDQRALQTLPEDKPEEVLGKLKELNTMVREMIGENHDGNTTAEDDHHDGNTTAEDDHHEEDTHEG